MTKSFEISLCYNYTYFLLLEVRQVAGELSLQKGAILIHMGTHQMQWLNLQVAICLVNYSFI